MPFFLVAAPDVFVLEGTEVGKYEAFCLPG